MKENEAILERQKTRIRFRNKDMDFMFNWAIGVATLVGLSPGQVFFAGQSIKDGNPDSWFDSFRKLSESEALRGTRASRDGHAIEAGQALLGAAYAMRAAIQFCRVEDPVFRSSASAMERSFQEGARLIGAPIEAIEIPFEGKSLAGYFLGDGNAERPTILMVGGGDTFREDLFYFAGLPAWKRGYDCLMVDLPGQGMMPDRGFTFRVDMHAPQKACIDWLAKRRGGDPGRLAAYGVSGGGYFSAQLAAADPRVSAWIAATPIYDMALIFRKEFGAAMRAPGWLLGAALKAAGRINRVAEASLGKYAWQFGTVDFKSAFAGAIREAVAVDLDRITCPSLFLASEGEGPELKRQAEAARDSLAARGVDVRLIEFTAAEGADAHCELNNLRLAHLRAFDWLDRVFARGPADPRLLA